MSIIRVEKNKNYSVINNTGIIDKNLSFKAKGILAYLLSKPDNWRCVPSDLAANSCDGQKAIYSGLRELRSQGYMIKRPIRDKRNVIVSWEEVLYETPEERAKTIYRQQLSRKERNSKSPGPTTYAKGTSGQAPLCQKPCMENGKILISSDEQNTKIKEEETSFSIDHGNIISTYKNCISEVITKAEDKILMELECKSDTSLIIKAITVASKGNAKNMNYIIAVLKDWQEKGLTTLDEVDVYLKNWCVKNKKAKENRENNINRRAQGNNTPKTALTNFADYNQREYDYVELEKKLLGIL